MITDQAYILHKKPYKDSSELIKLITSSHGLIDVVAKGSLRPKSKLKGQLQPFILTQINVIGKSELKTLIDAEQSTVLKHNAYINHVSMLYCNELLVLLKPDDDAIRTIFSAYSDTLIKLSTEPTVNLALRRFEWLLCCATGYELTIPSSIEDSDFIKFEPENGLVFDANKQFCQVLSFFDFLNDKILNKEQIKQVGWLMKAVVKHMIGGKVIQSRRLLTKTFDSKTFL